MKRGKIADFKNKIRPKRLFKDGASWDSTGLVEEQVGYFEKS